MKAPFPWFGGKSRCAHLVWDRFGDVPNYVEPFAGSLAVLLNRPTEPRCETVNDLDTYLANFWRAVTAAPDQVAHFANWPVNEADLHARHRWLVNQETFRTQMKADPDYFDAKVAGWWVWGICQWIGSGWCARPDWEGRSSASHNRGIHTDEYQSGGGVGVQSSRVAGKNIWQKRPSLERSNRGVHAKEMSKLPQLSGDGSGSGRGVHSQGIGSNLLDYMLALQDRLRRVRVCCGDWKRILGPSPTTCIGLTGVFLDPPYSKEAGRDAVYNNDDFKVAHDVREWALAHGDDPKLRIAVCGYDGEHHMPDTWECVAWNANGGYGNQGAGRGRVNSGRERIWFSPHCLRPEMEPELAL